MMDKVIAWKCDSCGMTSLYKSNVKRHERYCGKRPLNKDCRTCEHFESYKEDVYTGHKFGEATYDAVETVMICHKEIDLYTAYDGHIAEARNNCDLHELKGGSKWTLSSPALK
jgi:hypothetical protein